MSVSTISRVFIVIVFAITLNACSLVARQSTPSINIEPSVIVQLPTPDGLGYQLSASQLVTINWIVEGEEKSEQLPVQLQVTNTQVVVAGFSSWGTRILSLNYNGEQIKTEVLANIDGTLPDPEQVLFNVMITLWPSSAWEPSLNKIKWRLIDDEYSRTILNSSGEKMISIRYENRDKLKGKISFNHLQHPFSISIQTLQYQLN
ncbi:lipoprotein [Vibrio zhanjiangensis]|uniref:Lipoprotein n=1 Tax=Vibrio zhanjiangensis TaxID=1046128 RepID=A0ABQ6EYL9_9VIBR|nr:DUF3261 domain-containing protein [Vibrio zhanjiangensis]GLT18074.1 lipoprotein [Vibrio zhanjiangensis]